MRNMFLIARREYLERVRKRSFIISTILLPLFMYAAIVVPNRLVTMKIGAGKHIVVATSNAGFGEAVKRELASETKDPRQTKSKYTVDLDQNTTEAERAILRDKVGSGAIDGFVWIPDDAASTRKVSYAARETSDFVENAGLERAVSRAWSRQQLQERGLAAADIDNVFQDVDMDVITIKAGAESKVKGGPMAFLGAFVPVMLLYMTVLLYAVAVLRAVLEEKTSRVMEVLLSSVSAKDMMGGKILGVGAVGLSQIAIWVAMCMVAIAPAAGALGGMQLSKAALLSFGVFFLLGYLLYSTLYAALGATVNSEQEAQQWQSFIMMPLIISIIMMMFIIQHPNSSLAFWGSMIPFLAPILMYVRVVVQTPPLWQIVLSIGLMTATIYGMVVLCGRIYRVGILMYGKRATLPEILKWLKYA